MANSKIEKKISGSKTDYFSILTHKTTNIDSTLTQYPDHIYNGFININDNKNNNSGVFAAVARPNGTSGIYFEATKTINSVRYGHNLKILVDNSGNPTLELNGPAWRKAVINATSEKPLIANDTVGNWAKLGSCVCYYGYSDQITNKPSDYGLLLTTLDGNEISQLWFQQGSGKIYRRSGNGTSGWLNSSKWYEIYQENGSVIPIENGGTSATTKQAARISLFPSNMNNKAVTGIMCVTASYADGGYIDKEYLQAWLNTASRTQYPNDVGNRITRHDVEIHLGGGTGIRWYPLCKLPPTSNSNFASVMISGRMGGWIPETLNYVQATIMNRDSFYISSLIRGNSKASAQYRMDLQVYRQSDGDVVYLYTQEYSTAVLNFELYQCSYLYNGTYLTTTPPGTFLNKLSTANQKVELANNKVYVNGTALT